MTTHQLIKLALPKPNGTQPRFTATLATLPESASVRQWAYMVRDQLTEGSCVDQTTCGILEDILKRAGVPAQLSAQYVYWFARVLFGNPGRDEGSRLSDGPEAVERYGVTLENVWPYDPAMVNVPPPAEVVAIAQAMRDIRAERVANFMGGVDKNFGIGRMKAAIAMGFEIGLSLKVGYRIFGLNGSIANGGSAYTQPIDSGINAFAGGHAIRLTDYDSRGFIGPNSWGPGWGDGGYFLIGYDVIRSDAYESWTITGFNGHHFAPLISEETPAMVATLICPDVVYKGSINDQSILITPDVQNPEGGQLGARVRVLGGVPDYNYEWSADPALQAFDTAAPEVMKYVATVSGWAPGEARQFPITCQVDDTTIPSQRQVLTKTVTVVNDIDRNGVSGQLYRLYRGAFNRLPDPDGYWWWCGEMAGGKTLESVAAGFCSDIEFHTRYPSNDPKTYIAAFYRNVLGREPDEAGLNWWVGEYTSGRRSSAAILVGFTESPEAKALITW